MAKALTNKNDNLKRKKLTGVKLKEFEVGKAYIIKISAPFAPGVMKKKPCVFGFGTDNETGEIIKFLVPTVMFSTITENYTGIDYVGRVFELIKGEKLRGGNGNDYYSFELSEIEE